MKKVFLAVAVLAACLAADAAEEPDTAHLPNGCFIESVIFVETYLAANPGERADLYHLDMQEVGAKARAMHTLAIFTRAGKLYGRDHIIGDFFAGKAELVAKPIPMEKAILGAYREHLRERLARIYLIDADEIADHAIAAREAVERLTPFAARLGKPRRIILHSGGVATEAVVFAFKGNLVVYRPSVGALWVPIQKGDTFSQAIRSIPGLAGTERIEVPQVLTASR